MSYASSIVRLFVATIMLSSIGVCFIPCTRNFNKEFRVNADHHNEENRVYESESSIWNNQILEEAIIEAEYLQRQSRKSQLATTFTESSESMFSISYDPLEAPNQRTQLRDLEDTLRNRAMRFFDRTVVRAQERCYLVGLEDRSTLYAGRISDESELVNNFDARRNETETLSLKTVPFTLEESLTELSELAGAAGLTVVGSTYQRVQRPSADYYIGVGKTREIQRAMDRLQCTCVVFDTELTPSQQKNLELVFNEGERMNPKNKKQNMIKVIDRTALILDIFAQHAKTKEGQLQVQLALLTYRLPRLTNMWTHLERQTSSARGKSNGGVGLRGPGEKQLESDRRQMKTKIASLTRTIDNVRAHRSMHRRRRRRLGIPVIALVGYTNSGKSTLLNAFTQGEVFVADMLFATLDPTTRMINLPSVISTLSPDDQALYKASMAKTPDILMTDTVGFIQKLPTNLIAAFRATLEEIEEADILIHVADISNESWRKQEAAVLDELHSMGLTSKPLLTVWNKIDRLSADDRIQLTSIATERTRPTVCVSATTGEGFSTLIEHLQTMISANMQEISCFFDTSDATTMSSNGKVIGSSNRMLSIMYQMGMVDIVEPIGKEMNSYIFVSGRVPPFLYDQLKYLSQRQRREALSMKQENQPKMDSYVDENSQKLISFESELEIFISPIELMSANNHSTYINESIIGELINEQITMSTKRLQPASSTLVEDNEERIILIEKTKYNKKLANIIEKYRNELAPSLDNQANISIGAFRQELSDLLEEIQLNSIFENEDKDSNNAQVYDLDAEDEEIDWVGLARGRHRAIRSFESLNQQQPRNK